MTNKEVVVSPFEGNIYNRSSFNLVHTYMFSNHLINF